MAEENAKAAIGIVVVSHCDVAGEMVRATELIVGALEACRAIAITPREAVDDTVRRLREAIKEVDRGRGVLILTDLFGGTPANISLPFLSSRVEVVFGVNLPMLIKLASCRKTHTLEEAARVVRDYGRRHISVASDVLAKPVTSE
jgi:PTS system mannose-specific IIA component